MRVTVYTPQTLEISESVLPQLTDAARKRHRMAVDKQVPLRHIIEEARRAGLIQLGKDYVLDLEAATTSTNNGTRKGHQKVIKG